ncbi:MAG TPA: DUF72 domain-containing protein [Pyrinomonadaceae bacterium]|nr:DUF72 domain-containing protein [Pyrinomonadaceae bacterium]
MINVRIGISGWSYKEFRGKFYPKGLAQRLELEYSSERFNSIEINGTFYSLQSPASFEKWEAATPDDFLFAIKGSKYITHQKKLQDVRTPLANFFAQGVLRLGKKVGPILWQFAPWYRYNRERMTEFLELLPRSTAAAAELAAENTIKKPDGAFVDLIDDVPLRYAFEPRHESFFSEDFVSLLRDHNAALAFADAAGKFPYTEDVTADFVYVRLHGSTVLYASGYSDEELDDWTRKINAWKKGSEPRGTKKIVPGKFQPGTKRDVYVYFDNDIHSHAPYDAMNLATKLGVKWPK